MDLSKVTGYFILWIMMVAKIQGGPPSDPRGYRWSEWQACTSNCAGPNMRFRICEYQNNNGVSQCTPGDVVSEIDPNAPVDAPTTTTDTVPHYDITTTENLPVVTDTTTSENLPVVTDTTTSDNLLFVTDTTTTETLPVVEITTTTDSLPAVDTITTTGNEPVVETTTRNVLTVDTSSTTENVPGFSTTSTIESSTTAINTTTLYNSTNQNTNCSCECKNAVTWSVGGLNLTNEEAKQLIAELRQQLAVNVSTLSSTIRKKISATDNRVSSAAMGYVGTVVLATVVVVIVGCDLTVLIDGLRM
ncbi:uncharacterized protein LOC110450978 [Mizuhopecten yessoensis]|uniref:uncharacterized protein LOC110450978 n=1 Tax=Mizuhopecten yessoensis TaxID=6573 RepID=UPI000B45C378|nr:uncharacterized protein LOC110450978 [Mizuhopecten yessoensis]